MPHQWCQCHKLKYAGFTVKFQSKKPQTSVILIIQSSLIKRASLTLLNLIIATVAHYDHMIAYTLYSRSKKGV